MLHVLSYHYLEQTNTKRRQGGWPGLLCPLWKHVILCLLMSGRSMTVQQLALHKVLQDVTGRPRIVWLSILSHEPPVVCNSVEFISVWG